MCGFESIKVRFKFAFNVFCNCVVCAVKYGKKRINPIFFNLIGRNIGFNTYGYACVGAAYPTVLLNPRQVHEVGHHRVPEDPVHVRLDRWIRREPESQN